MLERFRTEVLAPFPGGDDDIDRSLRRINAESTEAAIDDRPQVALFEFIRGNDVDARFFELLWRDRNGNAIDPAAVVEAAGVFAEAEDRRALIFRVVAADAFKEA